jgi:hypothetical protein
MKVWGMMYLGIEVVQAFGHRYFESRLNRGHNLLVAIG